MVGRLRRLMPLSFLTPRRSKKVKKIAKERKGIAKVGAVLAREKVKKIAKAKGGAVLVPEKVKKIGKAEGHVVASCEHSDHRWP